MNRAFASRSYAQASGPDRTMAIDWSGSLVPSQQRRSIVAATCDVRTGKVQLEAGRLRTEVEQALLVLAEGGAQVVAGLDFSFSYPAWFLRELGCNSAPELWARVAEEGERWLREGHPQFWGRAKGSGPPVGHRGPQRLGYRTCELDVAVGGRSPGSGFQIGGAGAVGTGALRGMPMLLRLRQAGWSVWPFDAPRLPMLVEIYPRLLSGPVVKSRPRERAAYLRRPQFQHVSPEALEAAAKSQDAFDALVSAVAMAQHAKNFCELPRAGDEQTFLEGAIWQPPISAEKGRNDQGGGD